MSICPKISRQDIETFMATPEYELFVHFIGLINMIMITLR